MCFAMTISCQVILCCCSANVSAKLLRGTSRPKLEGTSCGQVYPNMLSLCNGFKQAVKMSLQQTKS